MTRPKLIFLSIFIFSLLISGSFCGIKQKQNNSGNQRRARDEDAADQIAAGVLKLSHKLASKVLLTSTSKHEVFSPISVSAALQLAMLGAKGNTYDELIKFLGYSDLNPITIHKEFSDIIKELMSNKKNERRKIVGWRKTASDQYVNISQRHQDKNENFDHHRIEVANGVFVESDVQIRKEFEDVVREENHAKIKVLNFKSKPAQASKVINDWVSRTTHGKITDIVPPVMNPNTKIVLANALYFKAEWQQTFIEGATGPKPFFPYGKGGKSIIVNMMAQGGQFPHYRDTELGVDILGFPYKQNCTTMYVILPTESSTERLKDVHSKLTPDMIDNMIDQMSIKTAVILFPKMNLSSGYHLKSDLQGLGVKELFDESLSDLSLLAKRNIGNDDITMPTDLLRQSHLANQSQNVGKSLHGRRIQRDVTYKVGSESQNATYPLTMKDFLNRKRIVKKSYKKKSKKSKREAARNFEEYNGGLEQNNRKVRNPQFGRETTENIEKLEMLRSQNLENPGLFADDVIHKVSLEITEKGTEGGAATAITLNRSGTSVIFRADVPFMFIIRHDFTKIPLFYGVVFEPPAVNDNNNQN